MLRRILCIALLALSGPCLGATPDARALAIEYLTLSHVEDALNESLRGYEEQLLPGLPAAEQAKLRNLLESTVSWQATKNELIDVVTGLYTVQELEASIAFMKTPLGASATSKSGEFSRRFSGIVVQKFQVAVQRLLPAGLSLPQ